jgi:hypothetical protein
MSRPIDAAFQGGRTVATETTLAAPRRSAKTYTDRRGREVYADTGRPVDEQFGTHVVLWIVDDPELWAKAIEAEGDAEPGKWPKSQRHIGEQRRLERHESAAQVRANGPRRNVNAVYFGAATAAAVVADLYRAHPNPGVRYEVAEITDVAACPDCHQPTIHADGQWWHHTGRFPVECSPRPEPEPEPKRARQAGEWEIGTRGYMICGYCDHKATWPQPITANWELTGYYTLGIERATGTLVVLAEATTPAGQTVHLPHHCQKIPDEVRVTYAADIAAARASHEGTASTPSP